jgi:hypothetical protein
MFSLKRLIFLCFIFLSANVLAISGYIKTDLSITDKDWSFVPTLTNSFNYSETSANEIFLLKDNFGLIYKTSNFELDLIRPVQPKILSLKANSTYTEILYTLNDQTAISISFKDQSADSQRIDRYTFSSLTIGYCNEAQIGISNSKEKYDPLGNASIMLIDAFNEEFQFKYYQASKSNFLDEYILYIGISKNKFDWLSPIEELTSGFISNLKFNGSRVGDLVTNEIKRLPQRDEFLIYKVGINLDKTINVYSFIDFFYEFDLLFVETKDYKVYKSINNHNLKLKTGFNLNFNENLIFSFSGSIYKNNLFGFEDISFNQRSEHQFDDPFGSLNASFKYIF